MDKVWFSGFKYHVNLVCHAQHIFTHLISTQSSVRVSIVTQDFSATNFKIFKRKNRREVFGVSSENILHLTVRGFARERIFSTYAQSKSQTSNLAKMLIQSTSPALLQNRCYLLTFICQFPRISHSNQKPRQCHYLTLFFAPFFFFSILRFYC